MNETHVGNYFYHNMFDMSQSQHRNVRVSKGSNKKIFGIKLFQFCDLQTQQRSILHEEVKFSKKLLSSVVEDLNDFLKTFDR